MRKDAVVKTPLTSSFLFCKRDAQAIIKLLFVDSDPYSNYLKRLLVINEKDCLDNTNNVYNDKIKEMSPRQLIKHGYIRLQPRLRFPQHEDVKSYILVTFDNFAPGDYNPSYVDYNITFDIFCNIDAWSLTDYSIRPLEIAGYIDGIFNFLNKERLNLSNSARVLSGIGQLELRGCNQIVLDQHLSGYSLTYRLVHLPSDQDKIPADE